MPKHRRLWSVAEAKAHLSDVIERARNEGPQEIARRGRRTAVVVSAEEWDRKTQRKGTLVEFLAASPLRGSGLEIKRLRDRPRKLDL
jgi:prevent-host-death family protein